MQASGQSELKEREETLDVFPGLVEVRLHRLKVRGRIASRRPGRRARAALRAVLVSGALGLIALTAWHTLPRGNGEKTAASAPVHPLTPSPLHPVIEAGPAPFMVITEKHTPSVELSPALRRAVRREWPGYRLRPAAAIESEALEELRLEHPEVRSPYAVSGDFDGDGRTDAALLLKKGRRALLVALHATASGRFEGRVLERGRWVDGHYLLSQPPGPVEYTAGRDDTQATAATVTLSAPAVRFHPVEAGARVYYCESGTYRSVEIGA